MKKFKNKEFMYLGIGSIGISNLIRYTIGGPEVILGFLSGFGLVMIVVGLLAKSNKIKAVKNKILKH